jgi:hypothetical protein
MLEPASPLHCPAQAHILGRRESARVKKNPALAQERAGLLPSNGYDSCSNLPNSDLAGFDSLRLWKMDGEQTLLYTSADARRVDAGIQIENPPVLTNSSLAMNSSSKVVRQSGAMAAKDELPVFNGHFYALFAYAWHFDLESKPVRVLMKVYNGREIFNALAAFRLGCC